MRLILKGGKAWASGPRRRLTARQLADLSRRWFALVKEMAMLVQRGEGCADE